MLRGMSVGIAVVIVSLAASACTSDARYDAEHPAYRDCGWSVTWQDTVYLGLDYVLADRNPPLTADDLIPVQPFTKLGTGFAPECPGDPTGSPVDVYSIQGIDPQIAVVTHDHLLGVAKGRTAPAQLLKHR
jgi:hypothetical protein